METSTSIDSIDAQSTSPFASDLNGLPDADNVTLNATQTPDVDPQILEALKSKDRIYVLKLGEIFEALIKERRWVSPAPIHKNTFTIPNTPFP
jgi:hypothetical protein